MVDRLAGQQRPDDLKGLGEHLVPLGAVRPGAGDVLVEVLPRAEAEREPARDMAPMVAACWATTAGW